ITVDDQPRPARAEPAGGRAGELLLERVEATELGVDGRGQLAAGRTAAVRAHHRPEQRVVGEAAPVVLHGGADVLQDAVDAAQQLLDALRCQLGVLLDGGVEVVGVPTVVLAVVDLHCARIDVRLEGVLGVGQIGQRESHAVVLLSLRFGADLATAGRAAPSRARRARSGRARRRDRVYQSRLARPGAGPTGAPAGTRH